MSPTVKAEETSTPRRRWRQPFSAPVVVVALAPLPLLPLLLLPLLPLLLLAQLVQVMLLSMLRRWQGWLPFLGLAGVYLSDDLDIAFGWGWKRCCKK